ncbi:ABC transporter ATP-binding protein [Saccharopolyspora karakumensis]|uniref:ABC transporter ATP-binding protein n=1 Tax=Saccharopolyspora karakumensis TaxID=2530386 RepID=A0A4R5BU40_9PSEU|nr:ABC transporter ATP-binding protein [Saccharopolyspora karakumensis]TDD90598.1 ABC transporter ATP-binding protein [Saccharopolyspora karakumensis]
MTQHSRPRPGPSYAVEAVDLVKTYGSGPAEVRALDGLSVRFPTGSFTAVMGPSGAGKSTLLQCSAGLDTPTAGRALIGGVDLAALRDDELTRVRRERIGFVFQQYNLLPELTAEENIVLPVQLAGRRPRRGALGELAERLGLSGRLGHRPAQLSGGQQQRVALGRALLTEPEVIFADEPTGNLDTRASGEILELLRASVRELGRTIVMVTHDPVAASYADGVVLVADGRLVDALAKPDAVTVAESLRLLGQRR